MSEVCAWSFCFINHSLDYRSLGYTKYLPVFKDLSLIALWDLIGTTWFFFRMNKTAQIMHSQKSNSVPFAYIFHLCVKHTRSFLKFTPVIELTSNLALSHQILKIISLRMLLYKENKNVFNDLGINLTISACTYFLSSKSNCVQKIKIYFFDEITVR